MRSIINTWEDALAAINFKKSVFYRLHRSPRPIKLQRPAVTSAAPEDIKQAKLIDQYTMLVETDVIDGVRGILL